MELYHFESYTELGQQLALDGRYLLAQHVSMSAMMLPQATRGERQYKRNALYSIATRYGLTPRSDTLTDEEDIPF